MRISSLPRLDSKPVDFRPWYAALPDYHGACVINSMHLFKERDFAKNSQKIVKRSLL